MLSLQAEEKAAQELGCDVAAIKAIDTVESGGQGFLSDGSGRLVMLFEPHIFWHELLKRGINPAEHMSYPGLLSNTWNPDLYEVGGTSHQKFAVATTINRDAAYCSASYGRYQILGQNYKLVGFNTPEDLVAFLKESEDNHLEVFVRTIKAFGLAKALAAHDWKAVAEGYNGKMYTKNHYDTKLMAAYTKAAQENLS